MKLVATILVATFVVAAGVSFAFADCAGHSGAQLVQKDSTPEQTSKNQIAVDKANESKSADASKNVVQTAEKK